jgi:hypothetical protein
MLAGWVWRNDGLGSAGGEPVAQGACVVGAVGQEPPARAANVEQRPCAGDVGRVARRQHEGDRPAEVVAQRVDLGRPAAARGANGMMTSPPFAPAAERWALIWVLSTEPENTPVEPVSA